MIKPRNDRVHQLNVFTRILNCPMNQQEIILEGEEKDDFLRETKMLNPSAAVKIIGTRRQDNPQNWDWAVLEGVHDKTTQ